MNPQLTGWLACLFVTGAYGLWAVWHHARTRRYIEQVEIALMNADQQNKALRAEINETLNTHVPYGIFNGYVAALISQLGARRIAIPDQVLEGFENELIYIHHDIEREQTFIQLQGPSQSMH